MTLNRSTTLSGSIVRRWKGFAHSALSLALILPIAASSFAGSLPDGRQNADTISWMQSTTQSPVKRECDLDAGRSGWGERMGDEIFYEPKLPVERRLRFPG
jgi:hypothetical protein